MSATTVKLRRVGDSTTMTIPSKVLKQLGWHEGEVVVLMVEEDTATTELIVRRA